MKMKRIINTLICPAVLLLALSCQQELIPETPVSVSESIVLDLSSGLTKAEEYQNVTEAYVDQLDVFIFEAAYDEPGALLVHETFKVDNASSVTLAAKRTGFTENEKYYVYLLANSTADLSDVTDFDDLERKQTDELLHLTGLDVPGAPKYFLMDAVAKDAGGNYPVVLYNGVKEEDTNLTALLARAAAKVVININASENVVFKNYGFEDGSEGGLFYVRNLPYDTWLLAETQTASQLQNVSLRTTAKTDTEYFTWNPDYAAGEKNVTLTTYVYPHHWDGESILDKETCAIINLPLDYIVSATETIAYPNSWYKIPMTDNSTFERNNIYQINIDLDRPGATEEAEPITLDDIYYEVEDWTEVTIGVGNEDRPEYLQLNTDHVDMYNVNIDETTLRFASSSEISSITLDAAFYYDKYDQRVDVPASIGISADAEADVLNGKITIYSSFVGLTEEEKEAEIAKLVKPVLSVTEPVEPTPVDAYGNPLAAPEPVQNPADIVAENPKNKETLDEIASKHSSSGWFGSVNVSYEWNGTAEGDVIFKDDSWWDDNAAENAQAEYEELLSNYENTIANYDSLLAEYNAYLDALKAYEDALAEWKNSSAYQQYVTEKQAFDAAYQIYSAEMQEYDAKVAAINNGAEDSHGNAIRYMSFTVKNETGQTAQFTVNQYPTLYITNEHGAYSYRSDFGSDFNNAGTRYNSVRWRNGGWDYETLTRDASGYLFRSKFYDEGQNRIRYYFWNNNGTRSQYDAGDLVNPRMYHVHITATSSLYTVARPRLDGDGFTESTLENSRLVSPSFMIASQLGATQSPSSVDIAKRHCAEYVEVKGDGTEYDDWRLPTAAEVEIIIQHQYTSDAMDEVMAGQRYWCAFTEDGNNYIYNSGSSSSSSNTAVRCVRDIY